jgi:DNA-binding response OmpR family regulator
MLKILVIDDEEEVLDMVSLVLKTTGYYVVKARNGEEGIKKFDELSFDIVITDFNMPFYNGEEVARHVRSASRNIPTICITGKPENIDQSDFDLVLEKPFSLKKLVEYIRLVESKKRPDLINI